MGYGSGMSCWGRLRDGQERGLLNPETDERRRRQGQSVARGHSPACQLLRDDAITIGAVNFFTGTMGTDFDGGHLRAMEIARSQINDYRPIRNPDHSPFRPIDSVAQHRNFASKLLS
jgi:hypothetical protein